MFGIINKPERIELDPVVAVDLDLVALASASVEKLGYRGLANAMNRGALAIVLAGLGIEPFDPQQVETYKHQMRAKWDGKTYTDGGMRYRYKANWSLKPLAGYGRPVPEFALDTALRIKEAMPTAQLAIDELNVESYADPIPPDPFLVVIEGEEKYYVEVWDEPEFEAKL